MGTVTTTFISASEDGRFPCNGMTHLATSKTSVPDVITHDLQSLNPRRRRRQSVISCLDKDEQLCVESVAAWCSKLGCATLAHVQSGGVNILATRARANPTLSNQTFFAGSPVFSMSNQQESCTGSGPATTPSSGPCSWTRGCWAGWTTRT